MNKKCLKIFSIEILTDRRGHFLSWKRTKTLMLVHKNKIQMLRKNHKVPKKIIICISKGSIGKTKKNKKKKIKIRHGHFSPWCCAVEPHTYTTNAGENGTIDDPSVISFSRKPTFLYRKITIVCFCSHLVSKVNFSSIATCLVYSTQACWSKGIWVFSNLAELCWSIRWFQL